jgi:hypothetical protein
VRRRRPVPGHEAGRILREDVVASAKLDSLLRPSGLRCSSRLTECRGRLGGWCATSGSASSPLPASELRIRLGERAKKPEKQMPDSPGAGPKPVPFGSGRGVAVTTRPGVGNHCRTIRPPHRRKAPPFVSPLPVFQGRVFQEDGRVVNPLAALIQSSPCPRTHSETARTVWVSSGLRCKATSSGCAPKGSPSEFCCRLAAGTAQLPPGADTP